MNNLIIPAILMCIGSAVIGFLVGHNKGFTDGFDYAVSHSKEVAEEVMKSSTMRIFKKEEDGRFTEVDKIGDEPTE